MTMPLDAHASVPVASPTARANVGCSRIWAVVQSYPQAERWANTNLTGRGYQTYLPLIAIRRRDRAVPTLWHTTERPLFTGYLFVAIGTGQWTPIRYCPGVLRLIVSGGKPNMAPAGAVEAIQAGEASRRTLTPPGELWAPGAACVARHGALAGHPGVVVSVSGSEARVAFMLFGALRNVRVPISSLVPRQ
jgi:transcription antitermination factor NusG